MLDPSFAWPDARPAATPGPGPLPPPSAMVDVSPLRLGDRMALAWWAQRQRLRHGTRWGVIDEARLLREPFCLARYFPLTFERLQAPPAQGLPERAPPHLWLTVTNAFDEDPVAGHFEALPRAVLARAAALRSARSRPRVLIHQLNDAVYNRARNWHPADAARLVPALQALGLEARLLNPAPGAFLGGFEEMLAQMLAADAFIGGDTGPSHVFALLCPDKPQLALYPDMRRDQRRYRPVQQGLGLALPWDSRPKRPDLHSLTLRPARRWTWRDRAPHWDRIGRFDAAAVAQSVASLLPVLPCAADAR